MNPLTEAALKINSNTIRKFVESSDPAERATLSATFDEIGALLKLREPTISVKNMWGLLKFLVSLGIECSDMYIVSRRSSGREVIYKIGYLSQEKTFDVITEDAGEDVNVGIMNTIKTKKGT